MIEQQNRRALAIERADNGIERAGVNVIHRIGASQTVGELVQRGLLGNAPLKHPLRARLGGDVKGQAPRVDEFPISNARTRSDQNLFDRAVLGTQPRRILIDLLVTQQAFENVVNRRFVDMKFSNVSADIFIHFIAQHIQLGMVGAHDRSVAGDEVQPDGGVLKKIFQLFACRIPARSNA